MGEVRSIVAKVVVVCVALTAVVGCPRPRDVGLALLVKPTSLDYGATTTTLSFKVSKVYSSKPMPPISVVANQPWIRVDSISPVSGVSSGPKDYITVTVSVDRSLMNAGKNTGSVSVAAEGIVPVNVSVTAELLLKANFKAESVIAFVGEPLAFFDQSVASASAGAILSWAWDFGDGGASTEQNPSHTYAAPGTYTVKLTAKTAGATDTAVKTNYVTVSVKVPATVAFSATPRIASVNQEVQFVDESTAGSLPITAWLWSFGDGGASTQQSPTHAYATPGKYDVTLTITAGTDQPSLTKPQYIEVTAVPPSADFTSDRERAITNETIRFTSKADPGTGPITGYLWTFGDGTTSTEVNPTKSYANPGAYDVSLKVTSPYGQDTEVKAAYIRVFQATPLDQYVKAFDTYTGFTFRNTLSGLGYSATTLELTSQAWRTYPEVDERVWKHWVTIVEPADVTRQTALLYITGGNRSDLSAPPTEIQPDVVSFALQSGAPVVVLTVVPSQPLRFQGEGASRSEHELVAYSLSKYLDGGDDYWPVLLPMVKSAVTAMDSVQSYLASRVIRPLTVDRFVVTGASKRGWAAWLTAAVDGRVSGVAPLVFDFLNAVPQLDRQLMAYGDYSTAWQPYTALNVLARLAEPRGGLLLSFIDPYAYRDRLVMPKYGINGTADEFFLPDSAQQYFGALSGEKRLRYMAGVGHDLGVGSYDEVLLDLLPWFDSVAGGGALPQFSWTLSGNQIVVDAATTPTVVTLHQATSALRDFRLGVSGPWSASTITPSSPGHYVAEVAAPAPGQYTAFFVEVEFPSGGPTPFVFTTEVQVTPNTMPYPPGGAD